MKAWILVISLLVSISGFASEYHRVIPMEILPILIANLRHIPPSEIYQQIMLYFSGFISYKDLDKKSKRLITRIQYTYDTNLILISEPEEPLVLISSQRSARFTINFEDLPVLFDAAPGLRQYIPDPSEMGNQDRTFLIPVSSQTLYLLNQVRLGHPIEEWLSQNSLGMLEEIHSESTNLEASQLEEIVGNFFKSRKSRLASDTVFIQFADKKFQTRFSILSPPGVKNFFTPFMERIFSYNDWVERDGQTYPRINLPDISWENFQHIYTSLATKTPLKREHKLNKAIVQTIEYLGYQDYFFPPKDLPKLKEIIKIDVKGLLFQFVLIPSGSFTMGNLETEANRKDNEIQKKVHVKNFLMQRTPVTRFHWNKILNKDTFLITNPDNPIIDISYNEIQEFIKLLNRHLAEIDSKILEVYLPSEEEWEYAARAGSQSTYPWGDDETLLKSFAWCPDKDLKNTCKVGQHLENAWGLHDMLGNCLEFTESNDQLIMKGGRTKHNCRSDYRQTSCKGELLKKDKQYYVGFRLAAKLR